MKPNMILVGRISRDKQEHKGLTNAEKLQRVEDYIEQYFWCGTTYIHNKELLLDENYPYPEYFSAGWYMLEMGDCIKQSIVVAHGSSMADANNKVVMLAKEIDWD